MMNTFFLTRILLAAGLALASSALSARESVRTTPPGQAASSKPRNVPASYIATPFGYMSPSCIIELKSYETLLGKRIFSKSDGSSRSIPPCPSPRFNRTGNKIKAPATGSATSALDGYDLVAGANLAEGTGVSFVFTEFPVPPAPLEQSDQSIYLFSALNNSSTPDANALLSVLGWNMFGLGTEWTLAAMKLDGSGQLVTRPPVTVNPGNKVDLAFTLAGQLKDAAKGPFEIDAALADFGTTSTYSGATMDQSINRFAPIAMASLGVDMCEKLPAGGSIGGGYQVLSSASAADQDIGDQVQVLSGEQSLCNMKLTISGDRTSTNYQFKMTYATSADTQAGRSAKLTYSNTN